MKLIWTKHAAREIIEDNFDPAEIEKNFEKVQEVYPEDGKTKGVLKLGERFCTIVYAKLECGIKIITCWESSEWERKAWKER